MNAEEREAEDTLVTLACFELARYGYALSPGCVRFVIRLVKRIEERGADNAVTDK